MKRARMLRKAERQARKIFKKIICPEVEPLVENFLKEIILPKLDDSLNIICKKILRTGTTHNSEQLEVFFDIIIDNDNFYLAIDEKIYVTLTRTKEEYELTQDTFNKILYSVFEKYGFKMFIFTINNEYQNKTILTYQAYII